MFKKQNGILLILLNIAKLVVGALQTIHIGLVNIYIYKRLNKVYNILI